ncbi:PREDICTED: uncharacterized protein LOC109580260 [Amphimedon queenslandica]|uniref:Metalloendopeptidase n=1 Tax=Amphimedon queenslandica TaxID=400682 RepID=A0AAN0IW98_AMPQE|nr:PREDICTED: uncharacterized protein LOC109580260 [Amphimedon queenslandica]|eukprot:XP_019848822.1 PREDICTED: uncharacterized protein LOC109580260 [Amphimedon queenslandica]
MKLVVLFLCLPFLGYCQIEPDQEFGSDDDNGMLEPPLPPVEKDSPLPAVEQDPPLPPVDEDSPIPLVEKDSSMPAVEQDPPLPPVDEDSPIPLVEKDSSMPAVEQDFIEQENSEDIAGNMDDMITDREEKMETEDDEDADLSEFETFVDEDDDDDTYLEPAEKEGVIVDGDILLSKTEAAIYKKSGWDGLAKTEAWVWGRRWGRKIRYRIHRSLRGSSNSILRRNIYASMRAIQSRTCIRFTTRRWGTSMRWRRRRGRWGRRRGGRRRMGRRRWGRRRWGRRRWGRRRWGRRRWGRRRWGRRRRSRWGRYMLFKKHSSKCFVRGIGGSLFGAKRIFLSKTCSGSRHPMTPAHEIMHAMGRYHEQSRPDRDRYIRVNSNTCPYQFRKVKRARIYGIPYDYYSVMHYSPYACGSPSMTILTPGINVGRMGQLRVLTTRDFQHINKRYCRSMMMRLVGGKGRNEGRVEVYNQNVWGSVCSNNFDMKDGNVICKYLGHPGLEEIYNKEETPSSMVRTSEGAIWMNNLQCNGYEETPFDCLQSTFGEHDCTHNQDCGPQVFQ